MISDDIAQDTGKRLERIAGQVRGVRRMIDERRYCMDVLDQLEAVRSALAGVGKIVLQNHIETCVAGAVRSRDRQDRAKKIAELVNLYGRFCGANSRGPGGGS